MRTGVVYSSEIITDKKFKPSFYLNDGKRLLASLNRNHGIIGVLSDIITIVFRPGIFKRVFVKNEMFGKPYFTASDMMKSSPLDYAKYLSCKLTENIDYMSVKKDYILISCAGTIGNIRLIDKKLHSAVASQDIIRVIPQLNNAGFVYTYLNTSFIQNYIQSKIYGTVVNRIEPIVIERLPLVSISQSTINEVENLIQESARFREEAADMLSEAERLLKTSANLRDLTPEDYDYFGPRGAGREVSCFVRKRRDITTTTFNAFNLSERIRKTKAAMNCTTRPLREVLVGGDTFSSCSVPSIEVKPEHGIMFINQKDIFDNIIKGKWVSKRNVSLDKLVEYGEVIVACDGTLGENELFCRALFANEDLQGALISTHFIRMKTNNVVPPGYLFTWLNCDYGFRFIRNCQAGTKLCHPIPIMFLDIPVPIISSDDMNRIDKLVKEAHTKRYEANENERKAIRMVEEEIEKWNK